MIITDIEPQKNPDRVNIFIDNVFALGISQELRFKYGLSINMEVNQAFIDDVLIEESFNHLISHSLNYLSFRQRSTKEMHTYLKTKGFSEDEIIRAIDYLTERQYLDDSLFAKSFLLDKTNLNKFGRKRIEYELRLKGIDSTTISNVIEENIDSDEELENCIKLASKKLPSYKNDDPIKRYRKLSGFLQRKGYDFSTINTAIDRVLKDEWKTFCLYGPM